MTAAERYQLVGPLATGGMAEVLLARAVGPRGFERLLAVKRIRPERAHDPEFVRMFLDEARNAAVLAHHRIVQVFDLEMRNGVLLYAMEYLHGQTLAAVLAREPRLPLEAAISIAVAVAEGLHHAHERASPIVHRDVAPSNVMITYDGAVKLIDFGIAKAASNLSHTVFGTFKGRLGYASPEQCRCEDVDRRTDVYSLGVMLYELTLGVPAFAAADETAMIAAMSDARIAPPRAIDPAYPAELEAIVMKALARDRDQRHASAAELQRNLEAFAQRAALNLSELAMARLMTRLFAAEVAPWQRARETGVTLEEHVLRTIGTTTVESPGFAGARSNAKRCGEAIDHRGPRQRAARRSHRVWAVRAISVLALVAAGYIATRLVVGS